MRSLLEYKQWHNQGRRATYEPVRRYIWTRLMIERLGKPCPIRCLHRYMFQSSEAVPS